MRNFGVLAGRLRAVRRVAEGLLQAGLFFLAEVSVAWMRVVGMGLWVGLCVVSPVAAQVPAHPKLAPALVTSWNMALRVAKAEDRNAPRGLVLEVEDAFTDDDVKALEAAGLSFDRVNGRVVRVGRFMGVLVQPAHVDALVQHPRVRQAWGFPRTVRPVAPGNPLGDTHAWARVEGVWRQRGVMSRRLQGTGITLCDLDGATDIFQPMFFRADAGRYRWLDVNANGALDVGLDVVDLDNDGEPDADEVLRALGGGTTDVYGTLTPAPGFQAARVYLYADTNGSNRREYGSAEGFGESTPGYGEPLFVVDDVNGDNALSPDEKLLRLGSNKYRGVYRPSTGITYTRGIDLVDLPVNTDAGHGSGVGGILVGGVFNRSWVQGLAPDADLLHVVQDGAPGEDVPGSPRYEGRIMTAIAWAESEGTDVFVHEYGTAVGEYADGSSAWEGLMDELSSRGSVQATAAHNFAGNEGRSRLVLAPGETRRVDVVAHDETYPGYPFYVLYVNARWRGAADDVTATFTALDGTTLDTNTTLEMDRHIIFGSRGASARGTGMVDFAYGRLNTAGTEYSALPLGTYAVTLVNNTAEPRTVDFYATDESVYALFIRVVAEHTSVSSMAWPSTADTAVAVAAFQVNTLARVTEAGDLAPYSGQGPRTDGMSSITVAAPADHYGALPATAGEGDGHYQVFDGTSGALPQVAAAIALLLQKEPGLTPAEVKARLVASAWTDARTGTVPNDAWGGGRLDVHALLFGAEAATNAAPVLAVNTGTCTAAGTPGTVDLSGTTDDGGGALVFRFDVDDDGTWEQDGSSPVFTTAFNVETRQVVRVEVEDALGAVAEGLAVITTQPGCGSGASSSSGGTSSGSAGDGPAPGGCAGCAAGDVTGWTACAWALVAWRARRRLSGDVPGP